MKYFILVILPILYIDSFAQIPRYYLPNDPQIIEKGNKNNWLKKNTEDALNNAYGFEYDDLYGFSTYFIPYSETLYQITRNETLSNIVFNWAKPYIKNKIENLNTIDKIKLYTSIRLSLNYLQQLDYAYEQRYLNANKKLFPYQGPNEYFGEDWKYPYPTELNNYNNRIFEAFLFRRIKDGVDKRMITRFLTEILLYIPVNFSKFINIETNTHKYEFYWNRTQFDGNYNEFDISKINGRDQTWLKITGKYQNGKKDGNWKYFTLEMNQRLLDYEIEYNNGTPIKLTKYSNLTVSTPTGNKEVYNLIQSLNIPYKTLDASVYHNNTLAVSFNSIHDNIDYWDLYDTEERISRYLSAPNVDLPINKTISLMDKPIVPRSKQTNNYTLYDRLKRTGKDHALLIATDEYNYWGASQKLKNPIRDAEAIAEDLRNIYGFNCDIIRNPTKVEFLASLEKYKKRKLEYDEQLFIFITGHGSYESGIKEGFIVPRDGKDAFSDFNHSSWISYTELLRNISEIQSNHILLTIDACYSGSLELAVSKSKSDDDDFTKRITDPEKWFFSRIKFKTRLYITSSAADRVTSDGINHSPFTSMFIQGLRSFGDKKTHILTISDVYAYIDRVIPSPIKDHFKDNEPESTFFFIMK